MTDSELVQGLRGHDPEALQRVREHYLPSLWRYVVSRVDGDPHVAEDIVSETMLALIKSFDGAPIDAAIVNLGGWLRRVAHNKVQDHFRALARVRHLIDAAKQTCPDADRDSDPAKRMEVDQRRRQVRLAMDQLSDQYRIALEWKYLDRLSTREISRRWGTTEKAVESILFRARREFRIRIQRGEVADGPPHRNATPRNPAPNQINGRATKATAPQPPPPTPTACDVSKP